MKKLTILMAVVAVGALCSGFGLKKTDKNIYAFGFAASFKDTVAFVTSIQVLDSVELERTTHFLPRRDLYSYQLKNYLESEMSRSGYTCMIFFSKKLKKMEKEMKKIRSLYGNGGMELRTIDPDRFRFRKPSDEE